MTETKGYFGQFGGSFVPEPIQALLDELEVTFEKYKDDPKFLNEYRHYLADYSGRETPLYFAESLTQHLGGAKMLGQTFCKVERGPSIWAELRFI